MKRLVTTFGVLCFAVLVVASAPAAAKDDLLDRKLTVHFKDTTCLYVLSTLVGDFHIPVGYERCPNEQDPYNVSIDLEDGTLRELLDALTAQEPAYLRASLIVSSRFA